MCLICASVTAGSPSPPSLAPASHEVVAAGRALLARHPSVDLHAHPGRFFMQDAGHTPLSAAYPAGDPDASIGEMYDGGVSAVFFSTVADLSVLEQGERSLQATRNFEPGEVIADHQRQLESARQLFARRQILLGRDAADVTSAHRSGALTGLLAIEGGDFIEDRLDRIAAAALAGVRMITIIHYRANQIGDTQTATPVHRGLTPLGRETIRAMESAGIIVDLSHATFEVIKDAVAMAMRPMVLSHSNIAPLSGPHPRLISSEHARLVTSTGGVVGCVPAGFAQSSLQDYVETILRMIDTLGIDHVAIGTDMDFTYRTVLPSYRGWPTLAGTLLARGLREEEVAKVMGGNAMRILQ